MNTVTANELKTKGISAVEARLKVDEEVITSVRGQDRYVVMGVEKYAKLREYEFAVALQEAKADVEAGRYTTESVADHMKRVADEVLAYLPRELCQESKKVLANAPGSG